MEKPVRETLAVPISLGPNNSDVSAYGITADGIPWGASRAIIQKPIRAVYEKLLDHTTVKDMNKVKFQVEVLPKKGFLEFHHISLKARVALFIVIEWEEHWGSILLSGTKENPEKILIIYQKAGGTSHLEHLCGSFLLTKNSANTTDAYLYEQILATRRSAEDTMDMTKWIMNRLRTEAP